MDDIDRRILGCLQEDSTMRVDEIAERVGLSSSPCWRRIRKLEERGYIAARVALLDPRKLNLNLTAFVTIRSPAYSDEWDERFCNAMLRLPEVVEMHRTNGSSDYILRIVAPSIADFDAIRRQIMHGFEYSDLRVSFSMTCIRRTTALPVKYAT